MSSERLPRPAIGLVDVVRGAHASQVVIGALLLCLAFASVGCGPGVVTLAWLALVTPSLVVFDLRLRRLPNVLVVPGFGAAVIDGCWAGISSGELPVAALATTSIVAVVMLVLNLVGGLGMGDVKLSIVMVGCLSLVSPLLAVSALMLAFFLGGGYSAVLLLSRRGHRGRRIAFGPVLLVAFWAVVALRAP